MTAAAFWPNALPLRLVWLTGLFRVIGGGDQVVVAIALVMVADVFSEEERYGPPARKYKIDIALIGR